MATILNPGTNPVTYTDDARVIAAGERLRDVTIDRITRAALDRGDLIEEIETESLGEPEVGDVEPSYPVAAPGVPAPEQAG